MLQQICSFCYCSSKWWVIDCISVLQSRIGVDPESLWKAVSLERKALKMHTNWRQARMWSRIWNGLAKYMTRSYRIAGFPNTPQISFSVWRWLGRPEGSVWAWNKWGRSSLAFFADMSFGGNQTEGSIDIGWESTFSWDSAVCYSLSTLEIHLVPDPTGLRNYSGWHYSMCEML